MSGVFTFTTWEDARCIRRYIEEHGVKKAVVVGGGLIGLKSVEALVKLGIQTTVVELADRILSATFDQAASDLAKKSLENAGVTVLCGTTLSAIEGDERAAGVVLREGDSLACDLVIFAIGVIPDMSIAEDAGISTDRGILVDPAMETSVPNVYAAGDVAEAVDMLSGKTRPIPILPNAYRQGVVAGANMAGGSASFSGGLAMNALDICGLATISVGVTSPEDDSYEIISALDEENSDYKKFVLKDNRLVGAIFIGQIDRAGIATGLIKSQIDISGVKDHLLDQDFGIISLPEEYRKHVVSGLGIEV